MSTCLHFPDIFYLLNNVNRIIANTAWMYVRPNLLAITTMIAYPRIERNALTCIFPTAVYVSRDTMKYLEPIKAFWTRSLFLYICRILSQSSIVFVRRCEDSSAWFVKRFRLYRRLSEFPFITSALSHLCSMTHNAIYAEEGATTN